MTPNGYLIFDGPSQIDRQRIIAIALTKSENVKTGNMMQTYILRQDLNPLKAVARGKDVSICGNCRHRGDGTGRRRSCYVTLMHGPLQVFKAFKLKKYPRVSLAELPSIGRDRQIRIGAYGDPGAVPTAIWQALTTHAAGWTGYTHQWRRRPDLQPLVMASVDSLEEHRQAITAGWRTFRIRSTPMPLLRNEIACPASEEAGRRTHCADCGLCNGTTGPARKTISILAHGTGRGHFATAA